MISDCTTLARTQVQVLDTPQETVEQALSLTQADGCAVIAEETTTANLRWANNNLTTNGVSHSRRLKVIATVDGARGTAVGVVSSSQVSRESVGALVRAAEAAARSCLPAEDAQPLPATPASCSRWDAPPLRTSIQVFSKFAPALGVAFSNARTDRRLLFGYAEHSCRSTFVGLSSGLRLRHDQLSGYVEINAKSPDYSSSVWAGMATRDFEDVNITALEMELTERLGWAKRRVALRPGRYETLLQPAAVADLMVQMYTSMGARDAIDGRSAFSRPGGGTRVGDRLTHAGITLRSDPWDPCLACAPFVTEHSANHNMSMFDIGFPLGATTWIEDGTLSALVQTRHSARLTGLPVSPYIDNLTLQSRTGGCPLADMIARTHRGLLLTCLWYISEVDPRTLQLTGLTRDGVFLVEGGEVVGAANNFRFEESPVELLGRIVESGRPERTIARQWRDYFPRTVMPALRIDGFNMSAESTAA